jgi:acyl-coenzyme A synthetase/AMP-(fatty) acid ligase
LELRAILTIITMTTLSNSFDPSASATAIIVPQGPDAFQISFKELFSHVSRFQQQLASLGIAPHDAVSIALPNTFEFVVAFLASTWQRAIAAPLNSAYKQEEFEFYIDDLKSALAIVPQGSVKANSPAVKAAQKFNAAIAECYWDKQKKEVVLDVKNGGKLSGKGSRSVERAQPNDVALVLHTSGTTGRPKAVSQSERLQYPNSNQLQVPLTHRNLTRTMRTRPS